jgi:hypothetical protein
MEAEQPGVSVAAVCRHHDIATSMVFRWRIQFGFGPDERARLAAVKVIDRRPGASSTPVVLHDLCRSPEVRPTAFTARPPDLPPRSLMTVDFAISSSLVRPGRPLIRCLSIGPRLCSTLSSDPTSRRRPCASLVLRRHQAGQRTSTSKLSFILGTQQKSPGLCRGFLVSSLEKV